MAALEAIPTEQRDAPFYLYQAALLLSVGRVDQARQIITINPGQRPGSPITKHPGVVYKGNLDNGQCGLKLEAGKVQDEEKWTCTLTTDSGSVLTGSVLIVVVSKLRRRTLHYIFLKVSIFYPQFKFNPGISF